MSRHAANKPRPRRFDTDGFITAARAVHGDRYDYCQCQFTGTNRKVTLICAKHGPFEIPAYRHLNGAGCQKCAGKARKTTEEFIAEARAIHGDRYDYSRVVYRNNATKVEVVCPEHGPFFPKPINHLVNQSGCPVCAGCNPTTLEDFLERARAAHGDRYDYSQVDYRGIRTKVIIVCPEHGPFEQIADSHMRGRGCPVCGAIQSVESKRWSTEEFVRRARLVHGDRYDYRQTVYVIGSAPVTIVCREHGPFEQVAHYHLAGNGCPLCAPNARVSQEDFLQRACESHGDRYDYSRMRYQGTLKPVEILCSEHGPFWQLPKYHMTGSGCPTCAGTQPVSLKLFIDRARQVHGDKYDYSRVRIVNTSTPVEILCPEHGAFHQRPTDHLNQGQGCPECAKRRPIDADRFLQRARAVHGDAYLYNMETYRGLKHKVDIICLTHGPFSQAAFNHLDGSGCPRCAGSISRAEQALAEWVESLGVTVRRNDREALGGLEIDIYVPDKGVGIEYHGSWWHSDEMQRRPRRHEEKADAAEHAGIRLITVWDFDLEQREGIVKRHLRHALGVTDEPALHARACMLRQIDNSAANALYDQQHIQGGVQRPMTSYGLFDADDRLVASMSFLQGGSRRGKFGADEWELIRFATTCSVRGGAGRLFAAFVREQDPQRVWSFSDRQHFSGRLYSQLGFVRDGDLAGDYRVIHKRTHQIWSKAAWQRRHIPKRLTELGIDEPYDPASDPRTEREMQALAGVIRIMDAGKVRWRWDRA